MKGRILVNINGEFIALKELPKEVREKQVEEMNRRVNKKESLQDRSSCKGD